MHGATYIFWASQLTDPPRSQLHLHLADTGHAVDRELLPNTGPPGPAPPPRTNADFFGYYAAQRICAAPADWAAAYAKFAEPLPRDFRLSAHSHEHAAAAVLGLLRTQEGTGLAPAGGAAMVPGTAWRVGRRDEATKRPQPCETYCPHEKQLGEAKL